MDQLTEKLIALGWLNTAGESVTWKYWHPTAADPTRPSRQERRLLALALREISNSEAGA